MAFKNLIIATVFFLFYVVAIFIPINYLLAIIVNFYIVRRLRICHNHFCSSKISLTAKKNVSSHLKIEFIIYTILILATFVICIYYLMIEKISDDLAVMNSLIFMITTLICVGYSSLRKLTDSEISYISSVNKLTLGYGCAIAYYKNYLCKIMPGHISSGAKQYENKEEVELPHKLYILCPKSCKVKKTIDFTKNIEDAKALHPFKMDHGGIKDREYKISVYKIKLNGEFFRCALEYAQPLKTLLNLKEKGTISISEMYNERKIFIENLTQLLKDRENSYECCEIVEYDDEASELHVVLSCLPSIQSYKSQTKNS